MKSGGKRGSATGAEEIHEDHCHNCERKNNDNTEVRGLFYLGSEGRRDPKVAGSFEKELTDFKGLQGCGRNQRGEWKVSKRKTRFENRGRFSIGLGWDDAG